MPRLLTLTLTLTLAQFAFADLPSPRLDRITPSGAAAGSRVEIEIAGADLEEPKRLIFDHPGLTATHVKERKFQVSVAADVPVGSYDVWAIGKYGLSSPRVFTVSRGFTEVEKAKNISDPTTAQRVAVNSIVNGTTDGNREDFYRFPAKKGQRIVIDCQAQAIDSPLDATLTLTDADGRPLASNGDTAGRDPLVDFVAPKDGNYIAIVADLSFRGGLPYRLTITDQPHFESVFPRAIQAGKPTEITVYGRNLGSRSRPSPWLVNDLPLDELRESVTAPADILKTAAFRFTNHPTTHSVLPTAATCTLTGFQIHGVPVLVTDTPVTLEQGPNDDAKSPQKLTIPAVVSGRFNKERDADWFTITPETEGAYTFSVLCERIAGRADPYLVVIDEKDNRVSELDDFGSRMNAFDGHIRDVQGTVNLSAKKTYRVLVQDRYRRGGARYQYVLTIQKAVADAYLAVIHHQNPGPGATTIHRGGAKYLDVILHHNGGVTGPVTITAEGLPKGLHMRPTTIPNDTRGTVVLWADVNAPEFVGPIKLVATIQDGDTVRKREVRPYTRVDATQNIAGSRPMRELIVAVLPEPTPFAVSFASDTATVEAGKKIDVKIQCERPWADFKGAITVNGLSLPNPVKIAQVTIPEGKTEATVTLDVQNGTRPGEYTFALLCQAQVPFTKDATKPKTNTLVSLPSRPITLTVTAAPGKK